MAAGGRLSASGGSWGRAEKVPGLAVLNKGNAGLDSVSCGSAGSCSAGGSYTDGSGHSQPFVVSQHKGRWGRAEKVRGRVALRAVRGASIYLVSCGAAGSCSAGGLYATHSSGRTNTRYQAFVVSQHKGSWGRAEKVPGLAALNTGGRATIYSVSCASAGSCSAGGLYATHSSGSYQVFVVSQHNGTWNHAEEVPGTAALNAGGDAVTSSVSCASAGNRSAVGSYKDRSGHHQAFIAIQAR